jgi:hypothetical protein
MIIVDEEKRKVTLGLTRIQEIMLADLATDILRNGYGSR